MRHSCLFRVNDRLETETAGNEERSLFLAVKENVVPYYVSNAFFKSVLILTMFKKSPASYPPVTHRISISVNQC
jgi:hypothetical protein